MIDIEEVHRALADRDAIIQRAAQKLEQQGTAAAEAATVKAELERKLADRERQLSECSARVVELEAKVRGLEEALAAAERPSLELVDLAQTNEPDEHSPGPVADEAAA